MGLDIFEYIFYLFFYSFLGWCYEVCAAAFSTGRFENRGIFNGPLCLNYGISFSLILLFLDRLGNTFVIQLIACMVVANTVDYLSVYFCRRALNLEKIPFEHNRYALGSRQGLLYTALLGLGAIMILHIFHPFVFILTHLIPKFALRILVLVMLVLFGVDLLATGFVFRLIRRENKMVKEISLSLKRTKASLGNRIYRKLRNHIYKLYPELDNADKPTLGKGFGTVTETVFAKGLSFSKLVWTFAICALGGDMIETFFVWATTGVFMSRSSLIYGTFSIVWGLGAALMTLVLYPLSKREDRYIFLGGFFLGGTYEYMCSIFTELVFGTVFWDYSHMPLNIGGRTNVLFMVFWGIIGVVWIKLIYPKISRIVERIPPIIGTVLTGCIIVFFVLDALISGMAMLRYTQRQREETPPANAIVQFLDESYPDWLIELIYPNMRISGSGERIGFEEEPR